MKQNSTTYRAVKDSFWTDVLILDLLPEEKLFYVWLFTNQHLDTCGCYQVNMRTMEYETGLSRDAIAILIQRFTDIGRIKYNADNREIILLKWKKNNAGFFEPTNRNSIKAIKAGANNIKTPEFMEIVLNWLGNDEPTIQGATLPPTLGGRVQPEPKPEPEPKEKNSSTTFVEESNGVDQQEENPSSSKIGLLDFRDAFYRATGSLLPVGCNNSATELCQHNPRDKLLECFRIMAEQGGRTFKYFSNIVEGKPKAVVEGKSKAQQRQDEAIANAQETRRILQERRNGSEIRGSASGGVAGVDSDVGCPRPDNGTSAVVYQTFG